MFHISRVSRKAILAGLFGLALSTSALATPPSTGLGQAWPNATDVSTSPHYHVYLFVRDGINYIQVNDTNGTVRAAYATASDTVLALPVGTDADSATTQPPASSASTETVYADGTVQVTATPQANGKVVVTATHCTDPYNCIGGSKSGI